MSFSNEFARLEPAARKRVGNLVGERQLGAQNAIVAHMHRQVLGLDPHAQRLEGVAMLVDADEVLEVAQGRRPAAADDVGGVWRACPDLKCEKSKLERNVAFPDAAANREGARRAGQRRRLDDIAPDAHHHRFLVDEGAGVAKPPPRLRQQNSHPELLKHA